MELPSNPEVTKFLLHLFAELADRYGIVPELIHSEQRPTKELKLWRLLSQPISELLWDSVISEEDDDALFERMWWRHAEERGRVPLQLYHRPLKEALIWNLGKPISLNVEELIQWHRL